MSALREEKSAANVTCCTLNCLCERKLYLWIVNLFTNRREGSLQKRCANRAGGTTLSTGSQDRGVRPFICPVSNG